MRTLLPVAAALIVAAPALAKPMRPEPVPVARLLKNVGAYVKAHPRDPDGLYTLGRIHYFAFAAPQPKPEETPSDTIDVYGADQPLPRVFGLMSPPGKNRAAGPSAYRRTPEQQAEHIRRAVTLLHQAISARDAGPKQQPEQPGLYELCLACALEDGAPWAKTVKGVPFVMPSPDSKAWREAAIRFYKLAYDRARPGDLKQEGGMGPSITEEAGSAYRRMVLARGATAAEKSVVAGIESTLKTLNERPRWVTPIVFSLTPSAGLTSLLAPERTISFDLSGGGEPQSVSWVGPSTAILVWDPNGTGKVTSGRQLFGSVTWWLFWEDGYHALAALDDNGDGWLSGKELEGLALWIDANQDGVSDPGEVVPIAQTAVEALATRSTGRDGLSPMNAAGLRLKGGQTLPTWDWVATVRR